MIVTFQFNMHLKLTLIIGECVIQEILTEEEEMLRGGTREPRRFSYTWIFRVVVQGKEICKTCAKIEHPRWGGYIRRVECNVLPRAPFRTRGLTPSTQEIVIIWRELPSQGLHLLLRGQTYLMIVISSGYPEVLKTMPISSIWDNSKGF